MVRLMVAAMLVASTAAFGDNVFDGLKFVMDYRGDGPNPANGVLGNMLDSTSVATRTASDGSSVARPQIVSETLTMPALPWETNTVRAIWVPQTLRAEDNKIYATAIDFAGCAVKTTTQTAYMRFKWDGAPNPTKGYAEWMILNGYNWNTKVDGGTGVGWGIGISNYSNADPAKGRFTVMVPPSQNTMTWNANLDIYPGVWYELFVVIKPTASNPSLTSMTLYLLKEPDERANSSPKMWNVPAFVSSTFNMEKGVLFADSESKVRFGAEEPTSGWWADSDVQYGAYSKAFNGKIAAAMMWDRELTLEERWQVVRNSFGYDWRFGSPNGSAAEFAADDSALAKDTVVAKTDAVGVIPNKLTEEKPTVTIKSPILAREAGLGKMLAIAPILSDGAVGKVALAVNGETIGTYDLGTLRGRNIVIPGAYWQAGTDGLVELALTRVAPFTGTLQFDAITLCGGWKMSGTMSEEGWARKRYDIGSNGPLVMQRATAISKYGRHDTVQIMASVPELDNDAVGYTFTIRVNGMGTYGGKPDTEQPHEFYVNGHKFADFPTVATGQVLKAKVPNEYLVEGENLFEIKNQVPLDEAVTHWVSYTYYQIDVRPRKGLAILYY